MSYSIDLRERVITFIESGSSKSAASRLFNVSVFSIDAWLKKKKLTGTVKDEKPKRNWKKVDPKLLESYVKSNSDLLLSDYAKHFGVSTVAICLIFKKLKITRKKRLCSTKNETNKSVQHFWNK